MMNWIVYDNKGETLDRYTVVAPNGAVYGMSGDNGAQGFNQYVGDLEQYPDGLEHTGVRRKHIPDCVIEGLLSRGYTLKDVFPLARGKMRRRIARAMQMGR